MSPKDAVPVEEMRQKYLECHADGHWWKNLGDTDLLRNTKQQVIEFTRHHKCQRCGKVRKTARTAPALMILTRSYSVIEGYSILRTDEGLHHKHAALLELLRREGSEI